MTTRWVWIDKSVVIALHEELLAEHGGPVGLRAPNGLDSALARPQQLEAYGQGADAADLAAAYAYGVSKNHPFVDGNKRVALVVAELFLALNGYELTATDAKCVSIFLNLAQGDLDENGLAGFLRTNITPQTV